MSQPICDGNDRSTPKKVPFGQWKAKNALGEHCVANDKRKEMKRIFKGKGEEESGLENKSKKWNKGGGLVEGRWSSREVEETDTEGRRSEPIMFRTHV